MAEEIDRFIAEQKSKLARERQQLQHPSNDQDVSNETANGYHKENIPPAHNADHAGPGAKALPSGSYENLRGNLNRQRQEEYKQFMQEKNQRSGERTKPSDGDGATLLIPDRASAQNRARLERNKEYNEFLKQQAHGKGRRATGKLDGDIPDNKITKASTNPVISNNPAAPARNGARSPTNRREFATQTPAPPTNHDDYPPAGPRKGWGTPQPVDYDDLLRRKRQEESRYRRHDDDYDYYPSRREGLRTSYSDPHLNRYPPEDGRYSRRPDPYEQEYDRRRVRFSNDDVSPRKDSYDRSYSRPPPPDRRDYPDEPGYDWGISQGGRSRTLPELERTKPAIKQDPETGAAGRQPRAKSATLVDDGFTIGNRESISAAKRKKDQYRLELEQQMKEAQEAKKRERQQDIKTAATGAVDSERIPRGASRTPGPSQTPAPSRHQQQQPQTNGYTPSFLNSTYNYNAYPPGPIGVQQGVPSRRVGNSSQPQVPELGLAEAIAKTELGGLGLEAAIAKSQTTMVERPFSIAPSASTRINQPNPGDPYAYYGLRHPLEPDPQTGGYMAGFPHSYPSLHQPIQLSSPNIMHSSPLLAANASPLLAANASLGVPPAGGGANSYQTGNPVIQQQQQQSQQQQRQIPSYSQQPQGGFSSDPRSPRAAKDTKSYQAQLLAQMQEQQDKKKKAKQEQERYEAKLEAEIANYNPWGKGGAGAPMRDQTGNIVADLKTLHNRNEHIQESPRDPKLQLFSDLQVPPTNPAAAAPGAAANNVTSPRIEATTGFSTGAEPSKFARGRGQLEPEKRQQGNPQDYKEMLRLQVEEKKRRDAEEKEKQRLEEEKEEKRLAAQRERMQKEFEVEQERQRKKKEEKEKQQQELERQLKEKQEAQEQKRKEQEEARLKREQAEDDRKRQELDQRRAAGQQGAANYNRSTVASPPIPALQPQNAKYNRSAVASPPIPTHQPQNAERTDSPPIPALRGNSDQRSDSPPIPTHNKKGSQPQEFPSQRPKSRAIKPSSDFDLVTWLRELDPALVQYAPALEENGYASLRTMSRLNKHTLLEICPDIKHAHAELILHETSRIETPRSKKAEEERRAKSPAIPQAAGSKDPRDVVRALSAMRQQLAVEQRRIQNQLEKHYDPHNQPSDGGGGAKKGTRSPQVDVFELARNKQKVAVHREPLNRPAAQEFSDLKNRGSQSRQRLREQYPGDPNSDITLEAQQRALLRNQQQRLEDMRKAEVSKKDKYSSMPGMSPSDFRLYDTPPVPLNSDSAFIGINTGETKMPEELRVPKPLASSRDVPSTSRPKQQQPDPLGSLASFDSGTLDFLAQKNKERNRALRALEPDLDSLAEADDILERFMIRESHDRKK